jgi:hypothetical protein
MDKRKENTKTNAFRTRKKSVEQLDVGKKYLIRDSGIFIYQGVAKAEISKSFSNKTVVEFSANNKTMFKDNSNKAGLKKPPYGKSMVMTLEQANVGIGTGYIKEATPDMEAKILLLGDEDGRRIQGRSKNQKRRV